MFAVLKQFGFNTDLPHVQAGLLSFIGVVLTGSIAILTWWLNRRKDRSDAKALRAEKRRDLLRAIRSDIFPVWSGLYELGTLEYRLDQVEKAFGQNAETYTPFITNVSGTIFETKLIEDVVFLKTDEIAPIVRFYHQVKAMNQMAADLQRDHYPNCTQSQKKAALFGLIALEDKTIETAEKALHEIETAINIQKNKRLAAEKSMLEARRPRLDSTGVDQ